MLTETPARRARKARRIPARVAARQLGYSVRYLLALERTGLWPEHRADEVARFYGVSVNDLLISSTPTGVQRSLRGPRAGRRVAASARPLAQREAATR